MKNSQMKLATLKYQLREYKNAGKKEVIRKLTDEQREYVETLGYATIPFLYEIVTKNFTNIKKVNGSIAKDIHYSNRKGRSKIYRKLKRQDLKILEENGIFYRSYKYRIILQ